MKILITGAYGFIGQQTVAAACTDGHEVVVWGNARNRGHNAFPHIRRLDCAFDTPDAVDHMKGIDAVIHLAGRYPLRGARQPSALELFQDNAALTAALLDTCARASIARFVLSSTAVVYGNTSSDPRKETQPLNGCTPYAASKISAESMVRAFTALGGRGISLRLFNVYGPGQPAQNVCATIAEQTLGDSDTPVQVHDDSPIRDFIHVADVARALLAAATTSGTLPDAVNIGSGQPTSVGELAIHIMRAAGRDNAIQVSNRSRPGQDVVIADIALARQILGWQPTIGLTHGIATTLDALRQANAAKAL